MKTPFNFGGLTAEYTNYIKAKIVVLPIPFDKTTTWGKGSDKGPKAMIEASMNMELYDIPTDSEVFLKGIFTAKDIKAPTPETMVKKAYEKVKEFLADNKFVVSLGGEHSVSVGPIKAYAEKFKNLSVLHLDAHSDRREEYDGSKLSHACAMARAEEIINPAPFKKGGRIKDVVPSAEEVAKSVVSVGIRSMDSSELKNIKKDKIFYAEEIRKSKNWIKEATNKLSKNVYVTIDLDVFDSSIMPSTGTPEPGGMDWYQVIDLLKKVSQNKNIVGFDVVELMPTANKAPDFLAAKLIYKLLSYKFCL